MDISSQIFWKAEATVAKQVTPTPPASTTATPALSTTSIKSYDFFALHQGTIFSSMLLGIY